MISSARRGTYDSETVATADGLLKALKNDEFRFIAILMKKILGIIKPGDSALQAREIDIIESLSIIDTIDDLLLQARDETTHALLREAADDLLKCKKDQENETKRRKIRVPIRDDFIITDSIPSVHDMALPP